MSTSYYFNERGTYVHVVRDINHHEWRGEYSHSGVHFRCGNLGFLSKERRAKVYSSPPAGRPLCQKCVVAERLLEKLEHMPKGQAMVSDGRDEKTLTITLSNLAEYRVTFPFPATPEEHVEFISKLRDLKAGMAPPKKKIKSKESS